MTQLIDETSVVVALPENVTADLVDEDVVILNMKDGVYYGLNPVGGRIWKLLKEPHTVSQIKDILMAEYEVEAGQCMRDLTALLVDLEQRGLIEIRPEGAG